MTAGRLSRAIAMMQPGMFLSQPGMATKPSYHCAPMTVSMESPMRSRLLPLAVFALAIFAAPAIAAELKVYEGRYYVIHTEFTGDELREADLRMSKMAEEYHNRTKDFAGTIDHKFPFFLYSNMD